MATIALEGIKIYAYHGFYEEEQLVGGYYLVDVYVHANTSYAALRDQLDMTVNYETLYRIVKTEMQYPSKLIEAVAQRIVDKVVAICNSAQGVRVRVTKLHPPLGGAVQQAALEMDYNYKAESLKKAGIATIVLEGIKLYAYHGFYEEEQLLGGYYIVDVSIYAQVSHAARQDQLDATVNYETLYRIVKTEMQYNSKLIEAVAQRIVDSVVAVCKNVQGIQVRVTKQNPPVGGDVKQAYVELEESYVVKCNRCGSLFLSHQRGDGWIKHGSVYPETRSILERKFGPNICRSCLAPHFIKDRSE